MFTVNHIPIKEVHYANISVGNNGLVAQSQTDMTKPPESLLDAASSYAYALYACQITQTPHYRPMNHAELGRISRDWTAAPTVGGSSPTPLPTALARGHGGNFNRVIYVAIYISVVWSSGPKHDHHSLYPASRTSVTKLTSKLTNQLMRNKWLWGHTIRQVWSHLSLKLGNIAIY